MITRSQLTGLWVASLLNDDGNVVAEEDFGCEYSARQWLAAKKEATR